MLFFCYSSFRTRESSHQKMIPNDISPEVYYPPRDEEACTQKELMVHAHLSEPGHRNRVDSRPTKLVAARFKTIQAGRFSIEDSKSLNKGESKNKGANKRRRCTQSSSEMPQQLLRTNITVNHWFRTISKNMMTTVRHESDLSSQENVDEGSALRITLVPSGTWPAKTVASTVWGLTRAILDSKRWLSESGSCISYGECFPCILLLPGNKCGEGYHFMNKIPLHASRMRISLSVTNISVRSFVSTKIASGSKSKPRFFDLGSDSTRDELRLYSHDRLMICNPHALIVFPVVEERYG